MNQVRLYLLLLWALALPVQATLFDDKSPLAVRLKADFTAMLATLDKSERTPATLTWTDNAGTHEEAVTLGLRGNFRLKFCELPGLRIHFDDAPGVFAGQDKLKLVTQCKHDSKKYQDYVLQEYDAYQAYEHLTPYSFKSRLVETTYVDTGSGTSRTEWSFVIEDWKDLRRRHDLPAYRENRISRDQLDATATARFTLFQYMIGNTDFSLLKGEGDEACCHNVKVLDAESGLIPVPYDFDLAGVIDASYAAPPVSLGIDEVTDRLYRGFCNHNDAFQAEAAHFRSEREALFNAFENELVRAKSRKKTRRFLEKFYKDLDREKRIETKILKTCR